MRKNNNLMALIKSHSCVIPAMKFLLKLKNSGLGKGTFVRTLIMKRVSLVRKAKTSNYPVINPNDGIKTAVTTVPNNFEDDDINTVKDAPKKLRKDEKERLNKNEDSRDVSSDKKKEKLNYENLAQNVAASKQKGIKETTNKRARAKVDLELMKEELKQLEDPPESNLEKELSINRVKYEFYDTQCELLAQKLLGKILARRLDNGIILRGRIVETESYLGEIDAASHTYNNRVTPRNLPMYMLPGTIYVYMTYGMYHCFNISSGGKGAAVLLRALEPLEGAEVMQANRLLDRKSKNVDKRAKNFHTHELCNGPSKLCMALQIDKECCKYSLCTWRKMWIENDLNYSMNNIKIIKCKRIGIDSVGSEWADKPLRYYIYGNKSVSKRDKNAEKDIIQH